VLILIAGLITLFAIPLAREGALFVQQLPHLIEESKAGRGVIGRLLNRTNALHYLQENQDRIRALLTGLTAPAARVVQTVATGVAGVITIFILALLMVLEGPKLVDGALNVVGDPQRRERIHQVGADCAKSITGYISGNLLISVICGGLIYAALKIMGVPFAGPIAIFVGFRRPHPARRRDPRRDRRGDRGSLSLHPSTHRGRHLLCGVSTAGEPRSATTHLVPDSQTQSAHSDYGDPGRG
jgi:predicted PurR-regulated permease PerM